MRKFMAKVFMSLAMVFMKKGDREAMTMALDTQIDHQKILNNELAKVAREWDKINEEHKKLAEMLKTVAQAAERHGIDLNKPTFH